MAKPRKTPPLATISGVYSGSYSDYRVHAIFEDPEDAETWAKALAEDKKAWASDAATEEFLLVPKGTKPFYVETWSLDIELWDDGTTSKERWHYRKELGICCLYGAPTKRPRIRYVRAPCHSDLGGRLEIRGSDREAVAKVYSDRLAMWKAGQWAGKGHRELEIPGGDGA